MVSARYPTTVVIFDLVAESRADVVVLLLHDAAAVAEFGERLGEAAAEPRAHSGCKDYGLKGQSLLLEGVIHYRFTDATLLRAWSMVAIGPGSCIMHCLRCRFVTLGRSSRVGDAY